MAFSSSPLRRMYLQPQTALGTVVTASGTWDPTTAKVVPHTKCDLQRNIQMIAADYKTGTGSMLAGVAGRASGSFSISAPMMPSGVAGTKPNIDALMQNIFGVAATLVAVTSVTYNLADGGSIPFSTVVFDRSGASMTQQFGIGCTASNFTLNIGGDSYLAIDADGGCYYVLESDNWANEDTAGKGSLTSSPTTEPTPSLTGTTIAAFAASNISIGGNTMTELISAQISGTTGRSMRTDGGGKYPVAVVQGRRSIGLRSLKFQNSDSANLSALKVLSASKGVADVVIVQGIGAGYVVTHTLKSVQFDQTRFTENGGGMDVEFSDNPAHASALTLIDDYKLAIT